MNNEAHGKRNLLLLGSSALAITALTTGLSLWMYRSSGDIYLDRSRPGYLPDKDEANEESDVKSSYTFSDTGALTPSDLTEYLKELKAVDNRIKAIPDPYSASPLSDQSLGITPAEPLPEDANAVK